MTIPTGDGRIPSPLRRRFAGRDRSARLSAGAGHQRDLFQSGVLRPFAPQIRRQLVPSHRSVFRPGPSRRFGHDGRRDERPGELALDGGGQAVSHAGSPGSRARNSRHDRRRVQSHGPRFLRLRRHAPPPSRVALQRLVHRSSRSTIPQRAETSSATRLVGFRSLPEFADDDAGDDLHPGPKQYVLDITARWMDPDRRRRSQRRHRWLAAGRGATKCPSDSGRSGTNTSAQSIRKLTPWPRFGTRQAPFSRKGNSRPR